MSIAGNPNGFVKLLIGALLSAVVFWVLDNHWQHALGLLPYILFLTCPLMHLFMHRGHHGQGGGHGHDRAN